jgi:hypothetical protein
MGLRENGAADGGGNEEENAGARDGDEKTPCQETAEWSHLGWLKRQFRVLLGISL